MPSPIRILLAFVTLFGALVIVSGAIDRYEREEKSATNWFLLQNLSQRVWRAHSPEEIHHCIQNGRLRSASFVDRLALATVLVESTARPLWVRRLEEALFKATSFLGMNIDISIGPGQIRPSTFQALLRHGLIPKTLQVDDLFELCSTLEVSKGYFTGFFPHSLVKGAIDNDIRLASLTTQGKGEFGALFLEAVRSYQGAASQKKAHGSKIYFSLVRSTTMDLSICFKAGSRLDDCN